MLEREISNDASPAAINKKSSCAPYAGTSLASNDGLSIVPPTTGGLSLNVEPRSNSLQHLQSALNLPLPCFAKHVVFPRPFTVQCFSDPPASPNVALRDVTPPYLVPPKEYECFGSISDSSSAPVKTTTLSDRLRRILKEARYRVRVNPCSSKAPSRSPFRRRTPSLSPSRRNVPSNARKWPAVSRWATPPRKNNRFQPGPPPVKAFTPAVLTGANSVPLPNRCPWIPSSQPTFPVNVKVASVVKDPIHSSLPTTAAVHRGLPARAPSYAAVCAASTRPQIIPPRVSSTSIVCASACSADFLPSQASPASCSGSSRPITSARSSRGPRLNKKKVSFAPGLPASQDDFVTHIRVSSIKTTCAPVSNLSNGSPSNNLNSPVSPNSRSRKQSALGSSHSSGTTRAPVTNTHCNVINVGAVPSGSASCNTSNSSYVMPHCVNTVNNVSSVPSGSDSINVGTSYNIVSSVVGGSTSVTHNSQTANTSTGAPSSGNCPPRTCRSGSTLKLVFPLIDSLDCTEVGCRLSYQSDTWTSCLRSLKRHLNKDHNVKITTTQKWCHTCEVLMPLKVSAHSCFRSSSSFIKTGKRYRFQCPDCHFSCQSRRGLFNHRQSHRRQNIANASQSRRVPVVHPPVIPPTMSQSVPLLNDEPLDIDRTDGIAVDDGAFVPPVTRNDSLQDIGSEFEFTSSGVLIDEPDLDPVDHTDSPSPSQVPFNGSASVTHLDSPLNSPPVNSFIVEADVSPIAQFRPLLREILDSPDTDWATFTSALNDVITTIRHHFQIPDAFVPSGGLASATSNLQDPKYLQRLYRRNRRRTLRKLLNDNAPFCDVDPAQVEEFFAVSPQEDRDINYDLLSLLPSSEVPFLLSPFSPAEVLSKLRSCENSAPGPDRLSYEHWRSIDPNCSILSCIFNICLKSKRVPQAWKYSKSFLLHKGGDPKDLSNWRPISLASTIVRLFSGCLPKRFRHWLEDQEIISRTQFYN